MAKWGCPVESILIVGGLATAFALATPANADCSSEKTKCLLECQAPAGGLFSPGNGSGDNEVCTARCTEKYQICVTPRQIPKATKQVTPIQPAPADASPEPMTAQPPRSGSHAQRKSGTRSKGESGTAVPTDGGGPPATTDNSDAQYSDFPLATTRPPVPSSAVKTASFCPRQAPGIKGWNGMVKCVVAQAKNGNATAAMAIGQLYDPDIALQDDDRLIAAGLPARGASWPSVEAKTYDRTQAVYWYRMAADQGLVPAMRRLFELADLARIDGISAITETDGAAWIHKAAATGDIQAETELCGFEISRMKNYAEAIDACYSAAKAGDPDAQYAMGRIYSEGLGRAANPAKAAKWMGLAAQGGSQNAKDWFEEQKSPAVQQQDAEREQKATANSELAARTHIAQVLSQSGFGQVPIDAIDSDHMGGFWTFKLLVTRNIHVYKFASDDARAQSAEQVDKGAVPAGTKAYVLVSQDGLVDERSPNGEIEIRAITGHRPTIGYAPSDAVAPRSN
jgi:TPR repeat protein